MSKAKTRLTITKEIEGNDEVYDILLTFSDKEAHLEGIAKTNVVRNLLAEVDDKLNLGMVNKTRESVAQEIFETIEKAKTFEDKYKIEIVVQKPSYLDFKRKFIDTRIADRVTEVRT